MKKYNYLFYVITVLCCVVGIIIGQFISNIIFTKTKNNEIWQTYYSQQTSIIGEQRFNKELKGYTIEKLSNNYLLIVYRKSGNDIYIYTYIVEKQNNEYIFKLAEDYK